MSKEQNIDDILKLLKDSVSNESSEISKSDDLDFGTNISNEALQEQLKNQYINSSDTYEAEDAESSESYLIDDEFLAEAVLSQEDDDNLEVNISSESEELHDGVGVIVEEMESAELGENDCEQQDFDDAELEDIPDNNVDELIAAMSPIRKEEFIQEDLDEEYVSEEISNEILFDATQPYGEEKVTEDYGEELISSIEPILEEITPDFDTPEFSEQEQIYADKSLDDEIDTENDDIVLIEEFEQSSNNEHGQEPEFKEDTVEQLKSDNASVVEEKHETFLASMRKTGIDFTTEEIYNSTVDKSDIREESSEEDISNISENVSTFEEAPISPEEELDLSTINLMMQFCEKQELEKTIGDEKVDDFLKFEDSTEVESVQSKDFEEKEYVDFGQNDDIQTRYRKNHTNSLISTLGCSFIAIVTLIFELLPTFGVELAGVLSYVEFPAVYALIGLQFVSFAAAIYYKKLWNGLKRAFSLTPNTHSIIALILGLTAVYDTIIVIILSVTGDPLPSMYNALAVIITALLAGADYLNVVLEMKAFGVYSSNAKKYTMVKECRHGGIGEKMYDGGLEEDKNIYSIKGIDFPNGFFRSMRAKHKKNKLLTLLTVPVLIVGIIASVVAAILGASAYTSTAAFIVCVYAILPVVLIFTEILPYTVAMIKLTKRGSAFAGTEAVKKYGDCHVFVFNDLHMFKKCKTEDVGIAMYDTSVGYLVLGCIDALYSKIGGPLSGMKMNLPDVFKFQNVAIKRITKNGIEAIIDKKHNLIVGEASFMQRYGLNFPPNEKDNGRSTLCVSLNGKISAKLSVKYETEPVFEMLAERLNAEGVSCAIQTYDPLINSAMLSDSRTIGSSPISVVHKNSEDFASDKTNRYRSEADGVISCGSRLKLAEVVVWLKRLKRLDSISQKIAIAFSLTGAIIATLLLIFGIVEYVNQLYVLLYLLSELIAMLVLTFTLLPTSKYFTVDALYSELEKENTKRIARQQKEETKRINKSNPKRTEETE